MAKLTNALRTALLGTQGVSELLTNGKIYVFAGTVPNSADDALTMGSTHTLLAVIDNGGSGIHFNTPTNGVLSKLNSETWSGTFAASGTPSFYRLCASGDNGQGAGGAATYRIQGTAGGPNDAAEMDVGASPVTSGNSVTLNVGTIRQPAA